MKKNAIEIGSTYTAKITNHVVPVRIDRANPQFETSDLEI